MSMMENIATLTGSLKFLVDMSGLHKFQAALKRTEAQMRQLDKQATQLQQRLNKSFGITGKTTQKAKLDAQMQRSSDKEFTLERKHARAKEAVFKAQLMQQKLVSAGTREQTFLQTASLKVQQAQAVAAAKEQKVLQERLKTKHGEAKVAATLQQAQLREARLQDVLIRRQQRSQQLQREQARHATTMERVEQSLIAARQRGIQMAEKHAISKRASAAREARAAISQDQRAQRFTMSAERHSAWQAKQNAPQGGGLPDFAIGLGAASAALYGLTSAIGYAAERVKQRQEGVVEAQGFNNTFSSISANPKIADSFRDAFVEIQMANGGVVDTETAKDFRTLAINLAETGKTQQQILATWSTRQQAFSVAGTTKDDNRELNKQLGQMASDGTGTAADANIINNRMPMLVPHVVRAFMREKGIKDYNKGLATFNKDLKGGKGVKYSWYESGMQSLVDANGPALERNRNSVASQQTRADNQVYLQANDINSDKELAGVIAERIAAETQLTESMKPLNQAFANFDVSLTKLATSMLRLTAGKNGDGTEKTDKDRAQEVGSAGFPEGIAIDPSVMGGGPKPSTGKDVQDPISRLFRYLTGTPDYENGPAKAVEVKPVNMAGIQFPKLDLSKFGVDPENLADGLYRQFRVPDMFNAEDAMRRATQFQPSYPAQPPVQQKEAPAPNVINNSTTTVQPANVNITINAAKADPEETARISRDVWREESVKMWRDADAANGSEVY